MSEGSGRKDATIGLPPIASKTGPCYFDASWQSEAMGLALAEARAAAELDEVPVGAVLFQDGEVLASAHNLRETNNDPLAHAECLALGAAARKLGSWRLDRAVMVVTLEPCPMCMGAMLQSRIPLVIYGADDPRAGAAGTLYDLACDPRLNHCIEVVRGVRRGESAELLQTFFREKRSR